MSGFRNLIFKTDVIRASPCEKGTYHICDQQRLRRPAKAQATHEGSDEPAHSGSLARAFAVRSHNIGMYLYQTSFYQLPVLVKFWS